MKLAIAVYDNFTALDAIGPYEVLSRLPGAETVFVGREKRPYRTDTKACAIVADASFAEIDRADLVIVPGGPDMNAIANDATLIAWLRKVHPTTQWTTSVCTGALALASAGILKGVEAVTHWAAMDLLAQLGAKPVKERVVMRGKVVTAAGVSAGIDMALTLAAKIAGEPFARAMQLAIEYDPQPPFDSGNAQTASPELVALVLQLMTGGAPTPSA
ncbi:MAG: DJ-1/PfpI family protein [bacterium]